MGTKESMKFYFFPTLMEIKNYDIIFHDSFFQFE